ncbi:hypothetical protein BJY01DRAFT_106796 [Aspergillus pseudoustus]|uniref:Uncharacterized protein n=1 Tax=Aspergillus pseudoustus TaxID=1810923 RepID=A0ABR4IV79_9EURO
MEGPGRSSSNMERAIQPLRPPWKHSTRIAPEVRNRIQPERSTLEHSIRSTPYKIRRSGLCVIIICPAYQIDGYPGFSTIQCRRAPRSAPPAARCDTGETRAEADILASSRHATNRANIASR